ncbi:MAG TPA: MarC family protein [Syntrophales bacterium]|nr:MarC family protein [Syntrophales bacterium]HOM06965.1 MarC family protein [Syntrophales bacterium]HON98826.1 MarC family protein [Syntrophales bacterium]HPC00914.1 MarC family protein [Syntrophales bacterium]HPQ06506.1 MarC family protein [Syntrophales bacterium]
MGSFLLCFVPLFVAVDAFGLLPVFFGLTQGMEARRLRRVIWESVATAAVVALVFAVAGTSLLRMLGVAIADFMIAGGVVLFAVSLADLLSAEKAALHIDRESMGAVPLGVPLITGPAVMTTSIVLVNEYGILPTAGAILANILIAGVVFTFASGLNRFLGQTGAGIVSKIGNLLLAAIAIMMIRKGLMSFL